MSDAEDDMTQPFRFLDLPPELRNRISELVVQHAQNDKIISPAHQLYSGKVHAYVHSKWEEGELTDQRPVHDGSIILNIVRYVLRLPLGSLSYSNLWHGSFSYIASQNPTATADGKRFQWRKYPSDESDEGEDGEEGEEGEEGEQSEQSEQSAQSEQSEQSEQGGEERESEENDEDDGEPADDDDGEIEFDECVHEGHVCNKACLFEPALARVSRQMRTESLGIFYGNNSFHFLVNTRACVPELPVRFWRGIGDTSLRMIKNFNITTTTVPPFDLQVSTKSDKTPDVRVAWRNVEFLLEGMVWSVKNTMTGDEYGYHESEDRVYDLAKWISEGRLCVLVIERALELWQRERERKVRNLEFDGGEWVV
ncbi:hypothetical protein LTR56_009351 [Elasticomyces elasticus]|nr:hypothetical protein LTR56_009351 [Elasticomyces elasticus]KAK3666335.1 hypothetical protein LTR22_002639 [Elasticomyces elasticus]KAK4917714.1 hypothetical protein LTR49_014391 [Elasticomyces elasticus]KAK5766275.1 hypothetical protein LTS12_003486 [Elasticomyces elasticus]